MDASGMDCGGVCVSDKDSEALDLVSHEGLSDVFVTSASHFERDSAGARLVRLGQPVYTQHAALGMFSNDAEREEGLRAVAIIPMRDEGRVLGCLNVASHVHDEVPPFARAALEAIAAQIGGAIVRLHAEKALGESEEQYRRIVETAQEGIWVIDADSNTQFVNEKMAEMLGYTVEEMDGAPLLAFIDEAGKPIAGRKLERRRHGIKETHEFKFRRKDGSDLYTLVATNPLFDGEGKYAGSLAMIADVTERKRAEKVLQDSEQRYRELFDNMNSGVAVV